MNGEQRPKGVGLPGRIASLALVGFTFLVSVGVAPSLKARLPRSGGTPIERGLASWYAKPQRTADGEQYHPEGMTAAHRTLPFGTIVSVRNLRNGKSALVRINDRGPFRKGRVIDLSRAAGRSLGLLHPGVAPVEIRIVASPPNAPA